MILALALVAALALPICRGTATVETRTVCEAGRCEVRGFVVCREERVDG